MHTTTGYGHCPTCKEKLDDNYIAIVEVSNAKNDETVLKIENAYRTGVIVWIRKLVAEEMFNLKITTPMLFGTPDLTEALSKIPTE